MSFLDEMRKDHPALKKKQKEVATKDHAAMFNALTRLAGSYTDVHQMIACSKMIEQTYLTSRKKRKPCDLPTIRSYIVTEMGTDLSLYEVRMLLLFVSIYRMDPVSKKKGYCNLMPPPRQKYAIFCQKLNDLVTKFNQHKKMSSFPSLLRMSSKKTLAPIEHRVEGKDGGSCDSYDNDTPPISRHNSNDAACQESKLSFEIRRTRSEPIRYVDKEDNLGNMCIELPHVDQHEKTLAFRVQTASLARQASRRKMLGTIDYAPSVLPPATSVTSPKKRGMAVPPPPPLMRAPSFNDKMDQEIFGDVTSMDTILRPDENGDVIARPRTAIAIEKIRFNRESESLKNEVFRMLKV